MRLALLHPAAGAAPAEVHLIETGEVVAWWLDAPLIGGAAAIADAAARPDAPGLLIAWSGGLGETLFERSPRTWMAGRGALEEAVAEVAPALERSGRRLLLRSHCRHALSDAPACAAFLAAHDGGPVGVAFDPASMFEASMLGGAEEHLERLFAALAGRCAATILFDIAEPGAGDPDALPRAVAPGDGLLGPARLGRLARERCRADSLVVAAGPAPAALCAAVAGG